MTRKKEKEKRHDFRHWHGFHVPFGETRLAMLISYKFGQVREKRMFLNVLLNVKQPVVFISHWTQHIFRHLVASKLNECGILSTRVASQQTNHDSTNGWVKSHWKPKRLYETALYHCPPALAAAFCGRPASSSDVTSSLHSVRIPMASSFFGCHTTLVLCLAGTLHYGYFFLSSCMSLEGERSYK